MDPALRVFSDLVRVPDPQIDLDRAALEIARVEHPDLVPKQHLERLDELARASGTAAITDRLGALHRLREFLFDDQGFAGNNKDYYDPRNSCLNDVLDRKLGIPITLSVVMMEVGRRVGLPILGVGLPGHFVVRADVANEPVLLDPFDAGAVLTHERACELVARALGRRVKLGEQHFAPTSRRQILSRMLMNLRSVYSRREDWSKALAVIDRLLILDAECAAYQRDRGTVLVKLGELHRGVADWERYLRRCPEAEDSENVREQLRKVRRRLAALN
jgi:regulator of sirC expression with transglutaminase-like and TPR domain